MNKNMLIIGAVIILVAIIAFVYVKNTEKTSSSYERITMGGARGDFVEPPPIEQECQQKLKIYKNSADFTNRKFTECKIVESKVGWTEKECPNGRSPQGCSICVLECRK